MCWFATRAPQRAKAKVQNLISSNSVAGAYLPACWLANPILHQLIIPGQLPTTVLPNMLSLILPWADFSRRDPIPTINPLLKTFCVFGGRWGAHSYSDLIWYNRINNKFRNRIPLLVLNFWQCDDKLNVGFERIIDESSFTFIVDSHWYVLFLTYWPTNIKWRSVMIQESIILIFFFPNASLEQNLENKTYIFLGLIRKLWEK